MRTGRMFAVLLFLVLVLGSVSSESAAGQPGAVANLDDGTWQIQTVDQGPVNAYMSGGSLLALDSAGRPHIGYAQYNEAFLLHCSIKYAWHDGVGWHLETVDDSGACEGYVSLALSRDDQPRLSYSCYSVVKYAWRDGDGWHVETAASGEVRGASLALDGSDRPRISYYDYLDMSVKYAEYDGVSWQISSVADGFQIFFPATALALDGAGHPHISYVPYVGGDCDLGYAWHDGTSWHTEVLGQHLPPGSRTSLAVDGLGRPCISYVVMAESGSVGELRYARREGAAWHITTLRSIENYGDTALRFDQAGRPHIAYATAYDALKYTWYDGVSWPVEDIDNEQGFPGGISLALDETGRPQVAWYDGSYASVVKYAQRSAPPAPPIFAEKQTWPSVELVNGQVLTYTVTLRGPGQQVRMVDPLPAAFEYVPGSVTPPAVYSPTARAVIWTGLLPTDTLQTVRFQVIPAGATGVFSVPVSIVNTAWLSRVQQGDTVSATAAITVSPAPLFLYKEATPREGLHGGDMLTYTLAFSGSGQVVRLWDPLPGHVQYVTDSLTSTTTPAAVYSPTVHAVIWEGPLLAEPLQMVRFQVTPEVSGTEPLSLSLPIVNTAWLTVTTGAESGRGIWCAAIANGLHLYLPLVWVQ